MGTAPPPEPPLVVVKPLNPQGGGTPPTSNLVVVKSWEAKGGTRVVPIGGTLLEEDSALKRSTRLSEKEKYEEEGEIYSIEKNEGWVGRGRRNR